MKQERVGSPLKIAAARVERFTESVIREMTRLARSEEHTSELQSQSNLVCRLLLEKKNKKHRQRYRPTHLESLHFSDRATRSRQHNPVAQQPCVRSPCSTCREHPPPSRESTHRYRR